MIQDRHAPSLQEIDARNRLPRQLPRMVELGDQPEAARRRGQASGQLGSDAEGVDHGHTRVNAQEADVRNTAEPVEDRGEGPVLKGERIASGENHLADRRISGDETHPLLQIRGRDPGGTARLHRGAAEAMAAVDGALPGRCQQDPIGIPAHQGGDRPVGGPRLAERVRPVAGRRLALGRGGDALPEDRIRRCEALQEAPVVGRDLHAGAGQEGRDPLDRRGVVFAGWGQGSPHPAAPALPSGPYRGLEVLRRAEGMPHLPFPIAVELRIETGGKRCHSM